ncbi:DUF4436 domain-containing protein [Mycolicibacter arupensis]|uniref:DUF4436 domain-containing protein n=2 Tax=Mycolicibacter arupensis TaxID=342002 RepID=A0A5B1MBG5_9MYCO|nr:DUF4436 domain-containing protein [Mycolicibacter arupensis]TXI50764.1 MAG: DUF4436 domain-containing protein [Mycolicibacter arupensis]
MRGRAAVSTNGPAVHWNRPRLLLILGMTVFFIASYVVTVALYERAGCGCPRHLTEGVASADGTTVVIDIEDLQTVKGTLTGKVTISPGPALLDPVRHGLTEELSIAVHSAVTPTKRTWSKGTVPGEFPVPLTISGNSSKWPFDHYQTGPVTVDVVRGDATMPERMSVTFVDHIAGWRNEIASDRDDGGPYRIALHRSPSTIAFGAVIVGVLVSLAVVAVLVANLTFLGWRKFQPPMTTWYAAMLFAVVPLRNALPDAPPIGSWIDVTVTLWVIVALVMSMMVFIFCWWRDLKPEPTTQV